MDEEVKADYAPIRSGEHVRHYTHFSLAMSASRRFARWVAWNIDGSAISKRPRKGIRFLLDDEYDATHQIGEGCDRDACRLRLPGQEPGRARQ